MPPAAQKWRPGACGRSVEEVLLHVAGDNYFVPALIGVPAPPETGIDGKDNKTVAVFEARDCLRAQQQRHTAVEQVNQLEPTTCRHWAHAINRAHCAVSVYCWNVTTLSPSNR